MRRYFLLIGIMILMGNVSIRGQLTTNSNEYHQAGDDTAENIEYVTVGSIMPYKVSPCYLGYLPEIQNPSIFKWWLNGNQTGFELLKMDGLTPLSSLPPPNNVFYQDSAIAIHWLKTGKYTIRVSEKAMFKNGPETCESADNFQTLDVIVTDRPYVSWKTDTLVEGCNLSGSNQQITLNLSGADKVTVFYDLIYIPNDNKAPDTAHFIKTFVLKNPQKIEDAIEIKIPNSKYGQYKVVITDVQDWISAKSGIRAGKTDIPQTSVVFNVIRATELTPIRMASIQDENEPNLSPVCLGTSAWYYSEGNDDWKYNWDVSGGNIVSNNNDSIEVLWDTPGLQTIAVNANTPEGCVSEYTYGHVQVELVESLFSSKLASICEGESFILKPDVFCESIRWSNGSEDAFITINHQGTYWVEAKLPSGCIARDTFILNINSGLTPYLGKDTTLCGNQQLLLDPGTIAREYEWSTGETTPTIRANAGAGNIWVKLSDNYGCISADTIHIGLCAPQSLTQEIPNAFTPNNDGDNDTWRIEFLDSYPGAAVTIHNRWGQMVYKTNNYPTEGWDGSSKGKELPMSTYFYVIELNNGSSPIVGSVNIIR